MFAAFDGLGVDAEPVVYSDDAVDALQDQFLALDGVLVWVNPIEHGKDRSKLDRLLQEVANAGVFVSAHPTVIQKMGTKEVLFTYQLAVTTVGTGTVNVSPQQPNYAPGTVVTLTAAPGAHYHFAGWSGDTTASTSPLSIAMSSNRSLTATFAIDSYSLTAASNGNGIVARTPDQPSYDYGTPVSVSATANPHFHFIGWTGDTTASNTPLPLTMVRNRTVSGNFDIDTHTLTVTSNGNGQVAKSPDEAFYDYGDFVTVAATPDVHYHFVGWSGDTTATDNPLTFRLVGNRSFAATFAIDTYPLTTDVSGSGTVQRNPDQPTYAYGSSVQLTATPATGWHFVQWTGDQTTTTNPLTVQINAKTTANATFEINTYALTTVVVGPSGSGGIDRDPALAQYPHGTVVDLYAAANTGYSFTGWDGAVKGTNPYQSLTMDGPKTVTASFVATTYTLDVNAQGSGTVLKQPDQASYPAGFTVDLIASPADTANHFLRWAGDADGRTPTTSVTLQHNSVATAMFVSNRYPVTSTIVGGGAVSRVPNLPDAYMGSTMELTATPQTGYQFDGWHGDVETNFNPVSFRVDSTMNITAQFIAAPPPTVTVVIPGGQGMVSRDPDLANYPVNSTVTLTATGVKGYRFASWTGDVETTYNPVSIMLDRNKTVTALFERDSYFVTISTIGFGSVNKNPNLATFAPGSQVTLTANPGVGSHFMSWSGDTAAVVNPLVVGVTRDRAITANFGYQISYVDTGRVRLVVSPKGPLYAALSSVTLTPAPVPGYRFTGWTGSASGSANPLVITMDSDKTIGATYVVDFCEVQTAVVGSGSIVMTPNAVVVPYASLVSMTAVSGAGWHFTGWRQTTMGHGPCPACDAPLQNPLNFSPTYDLTITATFEKNPFTLALGRSGQGDVDGTWQPADGPDSTVTLSATPQPGWHFVAWTGDVVGTANPMTIQLTGPASVEAQFAIGDAATAQAPAPSAATPIVAFALSPVTPNPAIGFADVEFLTPRDASVSLRIIDIQGREVAFLAGGSVSSGRHRVRWDGRKPDGAPMSGVFFARLVTPDGVLTRRFVLAR